MSEFSQEFENEIATILGPRYCWAIHTEPVKILMRLLLEERSYFEFLKKELETQKKEFLVYKSHTDDYVRDSYERENSGKWI